MCIRDSSWSTSLKFPEKSNVISIDHLAQLSRQVDENSCRSDAVLVLKNALKHEGVVSLIKQEAELKDDTSSRPKGVTNMKVGELPALLGRTIEARRKLEGFTDKGKKRIVSADPAKSKTLAQHLETYTRPVTLVRSRQEPKRWDFNMYLRMKPFHLINECFSLLKTKDEKLDLAKLGAVMEEHVWGYKSGLPEE